jgi:hypothetical protein
MKIRLMAAVLWQRVGISASVTFDTLVGQTPVPVLREIFIALGEGQWSRLALDWDWQEQLVVPMIPMIWLDGKQTRRLSASLFGVGKRI